MKTSSTMIASLALMGAGAALALGQANVITPTSINGTTTGKTKAAYVAAFGAVMVNRLEGNITRLNFDATKTEVYMSKNGRGTAIIIGDQAYKTAAGVGPCSTFAALKAAFPNLARVSGPDKRIWKSGRLWFRVDNDARTADPADSTVRGIMLVTAPAPRLAKTYIGNTVYDCGGPEY